MTDEVWVYGQWKSDRFGSGRIYQKKNQKGDIGISTRAICLVCLVVPSVHVKASSFVSRLLGCSTCAPSWPFCDRIRETCLPRAALYGPSEMQYKYGPVHTGARPRFYGSCNCSFSVAFAPL
jgi:hypothetical protein